MSSTITGLGSGFDINGWVSQLVAVRQSTTVAPLQQKLTALETKNTALTSLKSKFTTLQSSLQTFTKTVYNTSSDMWSQTSTKSSNDAYATVSSSGSVAASQVELFIEQIATATQAKSANSLGSVSKENAENVKFVNLANGQAKSGDFSMFLDGKEYQIQIGENDTLKDVIDKINEASGGLIQASVDDSGNFSLTAYKKNVTVDELGQEQVNFEVDENAQLILGSAGDNSNLASALKLHTKDGSYTYTSAYPVSVVNTSEGMGKAESGLGDVQFSGENNKGKIFINGAEIEVDGDMSLNSLISKINGNSDTHVRASYDSLTNKLILTSTETGKSNISLSSEDTNLLNVLGLTEGTGEDEKLAVGSQTLGQNAIVHINGNEVISNSNTITGESSGIANLSITVKKPTSDYSGNEKDDKSVVIDIEPDYSKVKSSLEAFVSAYNDVVSTTKTMTQTGGKIGRDSSLSSIVSQLRGITSTVSNNDGVYSMLAEIGITSDKDDVSKLKIDSSKLDKALKEDFESVKALLSDGYTAKEDNGIFDNVLKNISSVLDIEKGYFTNVADSVQSQINSMNNRIERANTRLNNYQIRLTKQFNKMDSTIAALNSQLSTFSSYIG
ncbi:MAG: flagellar filament capping protein FliD [Candidatus Gastranaerophilales bacterium]|nr:flagellar filament capping protein FliD [Candidatus Gastranaerophilales bacterium]